MEERKEEQIIHPEGEVEKGTGKELPEAVMVDTYGGRIEVEWDPEAPVTPFGQLAFFIQFLKTSRLFEPWVAESPLVYESPNAPTKTDILGTLLLSVLAGHRRYAHISTVRMDTVNPKLLGMRRVMSEDAARRAFQKVEEDEARSWQQRHLQKTYEPLLYEPYILDLDTTVKPLYGHQQGAEVGYNPHKPGRPAHIYHTYFIANLRLVLDVEAQPGKRKGAKYTQPSFWNWLEGRPRAAWPELVRGDCDFGNESMLAACEQRKLDYLFKLRLTKNVKALVRLVSQEGGWSEAGQDWQGVESSLKLMGWSQSRRVVVLRRQLKEKRKRPHGNRKNPPFLPFLEGVAEAEAYEYAVLVTSLKEGILGIAQHYRDRADAENSFDELKNQWGLSGYTTRDLKRCQIMARIVAQVYNWWSIFVRLAVPEKHLESISSRPLLLYGVGKQTQHARKTTLTITSLHSQARKITVLLKQLSGFLTYIAQKAEQLTQLDLWRTVLSAAFRHFLRGRLLNAPPLLQSG